jgi:hypothetical protein
VSEVLLVVDSDDTGAAMLGAAFRRHGWRVRLMDLRFSRPTLDGRRPGAAPPVVRLDGTPLTPDVVVNRTDTNRLGLPPAKVLDRQIATRWLARHLAAREEQGLLLACLDIWDRTCRLYNPLAAVDRALLRRAVEADMVARGLPLGRRPKAGETDGAGDRSDDGRQGVCWIVDGTVLAPSARPAGKPWEPVELSDITAQAIHQVAELAGLRLGRIDLWQTKAHGTVVTGWHPIPPFRDFWERTGTDVAALAAAAIVGEDPAPAPDFLVTDFEAGILDVQARSATGRL